MSIHKRPGSPHFQYEFEVGGRRFRGSCQTASRREAERAEREAKTKARADLAAGLAEPGRETIDNVFARYWTEHGHRAKAAKDLQAHMQQVLDIVGRNKLYVEVGNPDVSAFLARRREIGAMRFAGRKGFVRKGEISDGTLANILTTWQSIHSMARDVWELPIRNIAWGKLKPPRSKGRISAIDENKARELLRALPVHIQAIIMFALATACRSAQVLELTHRNLNLASRTAVVQKQKRKGMATEIKHLNDMALVALGMVMDRDRIYRAEDHVFDATNFRNIWVAARESVGLPNFRVHDLRHCFAVWAIDRGAPLHEVSAALGHSSLAVTARYAELCDRHAKGATDRIPLVTPLQIESRRDASSDSAEERRGVETSKTRRAT